MNRGTDADQVKQMVVVAKQAEQVVARGRALFDEANVVEFLAGRTIVIELYVVAERVSDELKIAHPGPLRALARAQDKYAHHHADIDRGVVVGAARTPPAAVVRRTRPATVRSMSPGRREGPRSASQKIPE